MFDRTLRGICVALFVASCALASCEKPGTAESVDITQTCLFSFSFSFPRHATLSQLPFFFLCVNFHHSRTFQTGNSATLFYAKRFESTLSTAAQTAAKWNITVPVSAAATPSSPLTVTVALVAQSGAQMRQLGSQDFRVSAAGAQCLVWEDVRFATAAGEQYYVTFRAAGCDGTALTLFADAAAPSDSFTVDTATQTITQLPHALDAVLTPYIDGWPCDVAQYAEDAQCCTFGAGAEATHTACSRAFYCCEPLAQCVETQDLCTSTSPSSLEPSSSAILDSSNTSPETSTSTSTISPELSSSVVPEPSSTSTISPEPSTSTTSPDPSSSDVPPAVTSSSTEDESSSSSDEWPDKWFAGVVAAAAAVALALVAFIIAGICTCCSKRKEVPDGGYDNYSDSFSDSDY